MGIRGLQPQTLAIPFAAGLNQKFDVRALEAPSLTIALDCQCDEIGGVQTRKPFGANTFTTDIYGGGTLSDMRRIVQNGRELLCFTKDTLYSWNASQSNWVDRGTHLAVATGEETVFASTGDQVDADRAELAGIVFHTWTDSGSVYIAAADSETGAVLLEPAVAGGGSRARLVALDTRVVLFVASATDLFAWLIDPADIEASLVTSTTVAASPNFATSGYYDVTRIIGADSCVFAYRRSTETSYTVGTLTAGGTLTSSTKVRTLNGPVAVSSSPDGVHVQVCRTVGTDIIGDLVTISGLVDVEVNQAIGTSDSTPNHISAAHRSVLDDSEYRCYVFWSDGSTMKSNWVDTVGDIGTEDTFVLLLNNASRAFDHEGRVYLWTSFLAESLAYSGGFAAQFRYSLQQTYFLYRDDGFLVAKAAGARAGDLASVSWLPGVQNLTGSDFAWCGITRGIINIGGGANRSKYGARSPRDITFTFDSNEARRCARLGSTLYITGGEILQYDGRQLTEVGFHIYPHTIALGPDTGGDITDGTYAYKQTWRWDNARGEIDRSTTATTGQIAVAGGPESVLVDWVPLYTTHKTQQPIAVETWRTAVNPTPDAPFYLVTSKDPTDVNPNRYLQNDRGVATGDQLEDELADDDLIGRETSADNGGILEPLSPPPATIIIASADRIFLAGVAGDPNRVWYSKLRNEGEVAAFHDALTVTVPRDGGEITGLAIMNETLIVFKATAVYGLPGDGFDNSGGGNNYGPARLLSADVGAISHESIAVAPMGCIFKSRKGWQLLGRGMSVDYIGGQISDYDSDEVIAVHVVEAQHQIRCLTSARMLVLDYLAHNWFEWTIASQVGATIWDGSHVLLSEQGATIELDDYSTGVDYGFDIETAWIPLGAPGWGRVWKIIVLGEYRSDCDVRIRLAKNYATTYFQDKTWTPSPTDIGGPLQVKHGPSTQELEAIKIRITATNRTVSELGVVSYLPPDGEALKLTRLSLELGVERGLRPLRTEQTQ